MIFAQVIYQLSVPGIVRSASEREYMNSVLEDELKVHASPDAINKDQLEALLKRTMTEYQDSSRTNLTMAASAMALYVGAVAVILFIIGDQSLKVFGAAGWL